MDSKNVFVTIIGSTNAGKSSLLNAFLGEKIAIVSDKAQTTRTKITGVLTKNPVQYVFMDTPGVHKPKNKLSEHMMEAVSEAVPGNDVLLLVMDVSRPVSEYETDLIESLKASRAKVILVLNKIDLFDNKEDLIPLIAERSELYPFEAVFPISVINGEGTDELLSEISKYSIEGPHFFPDDTLTDQPERVLAAEIIREKLLMLLKDEVPHGIAVTVETMRERDDKDILDIEANIFCEKDSHKGIVIGRQGSMLKKIGSLSRQDIENFFEIKTNLQLWVKVKHDWRNKEGMIKNFGLNLQK